MTTVFLLSPANCSGARARMLLSPNAGFPLARELRGVNGAEMGDVFAFLSGLYFRGKLSYARRFASIREADRSIVADGVLVITPGMGLRAPDTRVTPAALEQFASVSIDAGEANYRMPLDVSARALLHAIDRDARVVLLGSVATAKYVSVLLPVFGDQLWFPAEFVGRGDMSRGGLLLRAVAGGAELEYAPVAGATLHGTRPPKLPKMNNESRK